MSHGLYLFLLDDKPELKKAVVPQEALTNIFENSYGRSYCDENNWSEILFLARPGKKTTIYNKAKSAPNYEEAVQLAWGIALTDLRVFSDNTWSLGNNDEREAAIDKAQKRGAKYMDKLIRTEVPKRLSKLFVPGEELTERIRYSDEGHARWVRDSLTRSYTHYGSCYVPPFAHYLCEPEEWRLFDIRHDEGSREELFKIGASPILGVDIHT